MWSSSKWAFWFWNFGRLRDLVAGVGVCSTSTCSWRRGLDQRFERTPLSKTTWCIRHSAISHQARGLTGFSLSSICERVQVVAFDCCHEPCTTGDSHFRTPFPHHCGKSWRPSLWASDAVDWDNSCCVKDGRTTAWMANTTSTAYFMAGWQS